MKDEDMIQTPGDKNAPSVRGHPPWMARGSRQLSTQCGGVECIFEIGVYKFMPCIRYQSRNGK